ncbi:MAG: hypothetical protein Fur002_09850 [Anaerolineales bacterium]
MTNDEIIAAAIRLIKAGKKEAAQSILDPFLLKNPNHIVAWMWKAELFADDHEKIKVLEDCLLYNPGNAQAQQALSVLQARAKKPAPPPFSVSPFGGEESATSKISPFTETPAVKPPPPFTVSPFSTSPFMMEEEAPAAPQKPDGEAKPPPPFESAPQAKSSAPTAAAKKKPAKQNVALIAIGVVALVILFIAAYATYGVYLNGQVNQAYAARNCKQVAANGALASLYPNGLFDGQAQYAECSLKLQAEQAAAAKNWTNAVELARQYISAYPLGAFTAEMNAQIITALSSWSQQLLSEKDYSAAISRLEELISADPSGATAEPAREDMLQAYIAYAKDLADAQQFEAAEQSLKSGIGYFAADSARAKQLQGALAEAYIAWGNSQAANNNIENAVKYYQMAAEYAPGATDVNLLIAKAQLQDAVQTAEKGDFNRALQKVADVENAAQADNVKKEAESARETILQKYSESTSLQAAEQISLVMTSICGGQTPALPIFGRDEQNIRFGLVTQIAMQLPQGYAAETPGQLHYVGCVNEKEKEIEICNYSGRALTRLRYEWDLKLYQTSNGEEVAAQTFKGSDPADCKPKENFPAGVTERKAYGGKPTLNEIIQWMQALNLIK